MAGGEPEITIDLRSLRATLAKVKEEQGPRIHRNLRKSLRGVGDDIIADQKSLLSAPLPGMAQRTGKKLVRVKPKNGRKAYLRAVNVYEAKAASRKRTKGMRRKVAGSLKTRVVAGKTRSGIRIQANKNVGGVMTKVWNKKIFRHQVFGTDAYVAQYGQPYWWKPIKAGGVEARKKAEKAINDALNGKG
ncbi:hypothetical protein [Paeniglutamicibacter sp.]|uniref:hypothetical protein n=1 Tax=Paeniglutamicibacter sp. TaxID=1934391 RepID=UPI0039891FC4